MSTLNLKYFSCLSPLFKIQTTVRANTKPRQIFLVLLIHGVKDGVVA